MRSMIVRMRFPLPRPALAGLLRGHGLALHPAPQAREFRSNPTLIQIQHTTRIRCICICGGGGIPPHPSLHCAFGTYFAPPSEPGFFKKQSSLLFENTLRIPTHIQTMPQAMSLKEHRLWYGSMAVGVGFEPTIPFRVYRISSAAPSTGLSHPTSVRHSAGDGDPCALERTRTSNLFLRTELL